jgi:pyruvate,water dikinase
MVSRELGVPVLVGTGAATDLMLAGQEVTLSCPEGDTGDLYDGLLHLDVKY